MNRCLKYADTVENAIEQCIEKYGKDLRILLLPDGPMRLPTIK